jgi:hypothetical protein
MEGLVKNVPRVEILKRKHQFSVGISLYASPDLLVNLTLVCFFLTVFPFLVGVGSQVISTIHDCPEN